MSRDEEQARKFAVEWSTKSKGKIANLAGCYLRLLERCKLRFFLDRDNSGHWYLVPEQYRAEWNRWSNLDEDNEASWAEPPWARRLDGSPSRVTFELPVEEP